MDRLGNSKNEYINEYKNKCMHTDSYAFSTILKTSLAAGSSTATPNPPLPHLPPLLDQEWCITPTRAPVRANKARR